MKVYFDSTPSGLPDYTEHYKRIAKCVEDLGHEHTSRWIINFDSSFYQLPKEQWSNHYTQITGAINSADVVVVEITNSSMSIGMCIHQALISGKPIIAMHTADRKEIFLGGAEDVESKLLTIEYNLNNLEEKLKEALDYVTDWLDCRFTLILNAKIRKHLDKVAKSGTTRSAYIRKLIEKDIKRKSKKAK